MKHLTYEIAEEIRTKYAAGSISHQTLADEYGVSRRMIGFVIKRQVFISPDRTRLRHGHYVNRGKNGSSTVLTWISMIRRCTDPEHDNYKRYGGRGIEFDSRWLNFENFLEDMGERPEGYTLDRIDTNLGYFKDNCRWACKARQQHNRRDNKLSWEKIEQIKWMRSEGFTEKDIAIEFGVHQTTINRVVNGKRWKNEKPIVKPEDGTPRKA